MTKKISKFPMKPTVMEYDIPHNMLPHIFLARVASGEPIIQMRWRIHYDKMGAELNRVLVTEEVYPEIEERIQAAKAAAPFFAAKKVGLPDLGGNTADAASEILKLIAASLPQ